jgi:WD40 repeat protein
LFPGGELVREIDLGGRASWGVAENRLVAFVLDTDSETGHRLYRVRSWRLPDGEAEEMGTIDRTELGATFGVLDPGGNGWVYGKESDVFHRRLPISEDRPDRLIASHENTAQFAGFSKSGDRLWTRDETTQELRLWSISAPTTQPLEVVAPPVGLEEGIGARAAPDGRWLLDDTYSRDGKALLWDPSTLPGTNPLELRRSGSWHATLDVFDPGGDWVVASTHYMKELSFWPLRASFPAVVSGYETFPRRPVLFTPDDKWLATCWGQDRLRLWPLPGTVGREIRELIIPPGARSRLTIDSGGQRLFTVGYGHDLFVVPIDGAEPTRLEGFSGDSQLQQGAFSPSGRLAAAATFQSSDQRELRVWNLETGDVKVFDLPLPANESAEGSSSSGQEQNFPVWTLEFSDESTVFTAGTDGVLRWDLEAGTYEPFGSAKAGQPAQLWLSGDGKKLVTGFIGPAGDCGPLVLHDLPTGQSRELRTFATCPDLQFGGDRWLVFDDTLSVMAIGRPDGTIRVGRVGLDPPHLLTGHEGPVTGLAISPNRRWIASSGQDKTLRLWPMPDLDQRPLHMLPLEPLLARLETLTNLRAVRDLESSTGWKIEIGPFPGWQEVPTW